VLCALGWLGVWLAGWLCGWRRLARVLGAFLLTLMLVGADPLFTARRAASNSKTQKAQMHNERVFQNTEKALTVGLSPK